jgi:hypothetical protein
MVVGICRGTGFLFVGFVGKAIVTFSDDLRWLLPIPIRFTVWLKTKLPTSTRFIPTFRQVVHPTFQHQWKA